MSKLQLSMATGHYDHLADLVSGRVRPEGIELQALHLPIEEIFFRTFSFAEWDISEFSSAKYVSIIGSAGGDSRFTAIPVFPSRVFRQSGFYIATASGIRTAQDLTGRRVGIPEWTQTAGIYARAYLQHQCGVPLAGIRWVQGGVNEAGRTEKVSLTLAPGVGIEHIPDRALNDMLLAGDLDAIISAREPASFVAGDPRIARLWPDYRAIEEAYFRDTGIFPIMHLMVLKRDVVARYPWLAMNLLQAFEQAKANSLQRLSTIVNSPIAIPWSYHALRSAQEVFGSDLCPYGIEPNRRTLEAFLQYCHEQGVTHRLVPIDELFPPEVSKVAKV